jgi:hypothetical protein
MVREEDITWHKTTDMQSLWVYLEETLVEHVVGMTEEEDPIL